MRHIGLTFSSYTYTDISTGFFEEAQTVFADQAGKMIFKALDIEKDIGEQGYMEYSYDLVIGSLVLHATHDLRKTLNNVRRLLKPGGYLLIQEITNIDVLRVGFAMSGLPGWWLGREDGRRYSPCVTSAEWHGLLLETGFSGIDSITPEIDILPRPLSVIAAQATNEQIECLRKPLMHPEESLGTSTMDLVVVGGQTLRTIVLIDEVTRLLRPWRFSVTRVRSLQELNSADITPTSLVLNATELDKPLWEDFSADAMSGLKQLMDSQRTILWLTQGSRSRQPYMNMSVGFGRSIALEMPDLQLQFIDLDASERPNPQLIAEALLRLHFTVALENQGVSDSILWSTEQEIVYEGGRQIIPRLRVNQKLNDRYNASKRTIVENKDAQDCIFELRLSGSGYDLVETSVFDGRILDEKSTSSETQVHVTYSSLMSAATGHTGTTYIILGNDGHGEKVVGLSRSNGNRLLVQKSNLIPYNLSEGMETFFLARLQIELIANMILSFCADDSKVLVHETSPEVAARLLARATEKNVNYWFSGPNRGFFGDSWLTIHPRAPSRTIKAALPLGISVFIDCSPVTKPGSFGSRLSGCLPTPCLRSSLFDIKAHVERAESSEQKVLEEFQLATSRALSQVYMERPDAYKLTPVNIVTPQDAARLNSQEMGDSTIIEWTLSGKIPLQLSSVESQTHFPADKTYIFFGLTSDLGTSLCDWFVSRGARNLVLTSRNPRIDSRWLEQMKTGGARVEVFAKFVTKSVLFSWLC